MPVKLDDLPEQAQRPARPRLWLWLGMLLISLLLSVGLMLFFDSQSLHEQPVEFRGIYLGGALAVWCMLGFGRMLFYISQHSLADGWDEARDEDLNRSIQRGRRSLQLLDASTYTALRAPGVTPTEQLNALLKGTGALKAQLSRSGEVMRHSRLPGEAQEDPERQLLNIFARILGDLAQSLARLPAEMPLSLLLEVDSALPENRLRRLWRQAWIESGIRQSTLPIGGIGLEAIDQWLDHRIGDKALLLVLAVQFAPEEPDVAAEAAAALLLGNHLTQAILPPMAFLHRPEQQREPTADALHHAALQALDWVPLETCSVDHAWRSGVDAKHDAALAAALVEGANSVKGDQGFHNLDVLLGHPGKVAPWLAIATATQAIQSGAGPQFIFSGGSSFESRIWCTAVTPASSLVK